jgi:hypothetical protein
MTDITVSGGVDGVGAKLDDMRLQAQQLSTLSGELIARSGTAAAKAVDGDLLESMILSPITGATAEGAIVVASGTLLLVATETGVSAVFLEGAVVAYETADQVIAAATVALHNGVAFVVGALAVPVALVAAAGTVVVGGVVALGVIGGNVVIEGVESLVDGAQRTAEQLGDNPWLLLSPAGVAGLFGANSIAAYSPQGRGPHGHGLRHSAQEPPRTRGLREHRARRERVAGRRPHGRCARTALGARVHRQPARPRSRSGAAGTHRTWLATAHL